MIAVDVVVGGAMHSTRFCMYVQEACVALAVPDKHVSHSTTQCVAEPSDQPNKHTGRLKATDGNALPWRRTWKKREFKQNHKKKQFVLVVDLVQVITIAIEQTGMPRFVSLVSEVFLVGRGTA